MPRGARRASGGRELQGLRRWVCGVWGVRRALWGFVAWAYQPMFKPPRLECLGVC